MSWSQRFLNIPDGKSLGKRIEVMAIDLLEGYLLAAISAELPTIINEKLHRDLVYISRITITYSVSNDNEIKLRHD